MTIGASIAAIRQPFVGFLLAGQQLTFYGSTEPKEIAITEQYLEDKLHDAAPIRLFLGITDLQDGERTVRAAVYRPSIIDVIYMEFPDKLTPCGKTRLKPDLTFRTADGDTWTGVVLVPEEKADAILAGCSMQNGRLSPERVVEQKAEYQKGFNALKAG